MSSRKKHPLALSIARRAATALALGAVGELTARERDVLERRSRGTSRDQVARELEITPERVRQLQFVGLRILEATARAREAGAA